MKKEVRAFLSGVYTSKEHRKRGLETALSVEFRIFVAHRKNEEQPLVIETTVCRAGSSTYVFRLRE
jgi:hypothetical protein